MKVKKFEIKYYIYSVMTQKMEVWTQIQSPETKQINIKKFVVTGCHKTGGSQETR